MIAVISSYLCESNPTLRNDENHGEIEVICKGCGVSVSCRDTGRKVDGRVSVVVSVPGRSDDSSLSAHFPNEQSEQLPILPERDKSELPVSLISFAKMCGYLRGWLSWDSTHNCQHVSL